MLYVADPTSGAAMASAGGVATVAPASASACDAAAAVE